MNGRRAYVLIVLALACDGRDGPSTTSTQTQQTHSSSMVANATGTRLFVAHPDTDSVSILEIASRRILSEQLLSSKAPATDSAGRYEPSVGPRALALNSAGSVLYVTGQRSGHVYALDASNAKLQSDAFVCSEPIGVLVSADDAHVFVACAQDDEVVEVSAKDLQVIARATCPRKPWALAWAADSETLLATHLLGPGVSRFSTDPLTLTNTWTLADGRPAIPDPSSPDQSDPTEPHGEVRGIYDAVLRPGTSELWVAHLMLGTDTPQPTLDFKRTAFPAVSIVDADAGTQLARLSVQANTGDDGAFGDVVSGPHALTFSDDGKLAFVVDSNSEDVLVVDAEQRIETQLVRPLPGHMPEAIVWTGGKIFVQQRNTEDIAAFRVTTDSDNVTVTADGGAFASVKADPMPAQLRFGQKLFFSANSDDVPLTQNHWLACASCHVEGRSDAVTWLFSQGPRDTPTNAGGLLDTGFLFRTADRSRVQDYWRTIAIEQGGHFDGFDSSQQPLLDAIAAYVNYAIPTPVPPSTDLTHGLRAQDLTDLRLRGKTVFDAVHCGDCHSGPAMTDSGASNPALDLSGPVVSTATEGGVLLHDVGTCASGDPAPDVAHTDIQGHLRDACAFDTPQLRGLADSAPYFHDGSAQTLESVLPSQLKAGVAAGGPIPVPVLSADDQRALIEYLRSL